MNPADVLMYGHRHVLRTLDGLDFADWDTGGVCGVWSVKDIISHLASYEQLLVEILAGFAGMDMPTPVSEHMRNAADDSAFNDEEVAMRQHLSPQHVLAEYNQAYERVAELAGKIAPETWRANGTLPWYGPEYSLEDYIVYTYYGHKREHCAQINVYRDTLRDGS